MNNVNINNLNIPGHLIFSTDFFSVEYSNNTKSFRIQMQKFAFLENKEKIIDEFSKIIENLQKDNVYWGNYDYAKEMNSGRAPKEHDGSPCGYSTDPRTALGKIAE